MRKSEEVEPKTGKQEQLETQSTMQIVVGTCVKTLLWILFIGFYACLSMYIISPSTTAKICNNLGMAKTEAQCYYRIYQQEKIDTNLYNYINKLGSSGQLAKQNEYIGVLENSKTYTDFCAAVDASAVQKYNAGSISAKDFVLLYGTQEFLQATKITNMLSLGQYDNALTAMQKYLESPEKTSVLGYYYINYLYEGGVSAQTAKTYAEKFYASNDYSTLVERLSELENAENTEMEQADAETDQTLAQILIEKLEKVKLTYTIYVTQKLVGETDLEDAKTAYDTAYADYIKLI